MSEKNAKLLRKYCRMFGVDPKDKSLDVVRRIFAGNDPTAKSGMRRFLAKEIAEKAEDYRLYDRMLFSTLSRSDRKMLGL